jgi:hypothetical protein
MTGRLPGRVRSLSLLSLILAFAWAGSASAQEQRDCADFSTQEEAQAFYNDHTDDEAGNPDPFNLDTDKDGQACEGLPTSAQAPTTSATPAPTAAAGDQSLPQNGAETGVIALSGLSLLEAGYGLTLASKRLGIRRRAIPLYLMRKMINAAEKGSDRVEISDDVYLVHRSALEQATDDESAERPVDPPVETPVETETIDDDAEPVGFDLAPLADEEPAPPVRAPNVYAALARPNTLKRES